MSDPNSLFPELVASILPVRNANSQALQPRPTESETLAVRLTNSLAECDSS